MTRPRLQSADSPDKNVFVFDEETFQTMVNELNDETKNQTDKKKERGQHKRLHARTILFTKLKTMLNKKIGRKQLNSKSGDQTPPPIFESTSLSLSWASLKRRWKIMRGNIYLMTRHSSEFGGISLRSFW